MVFDFSDIGLSMTEPYDILIVANMGDNYLPTDGSQTLADWKSVIQRKIIKRQKRKFKCLCRVQIQMYRNILRNHWKATLC